MTVKLDSEDLEFLKQSRNLAKENGLPNNMFFVIDEFIHSNPSNELREKLKECIIMIEESPRMASADRLLRILIQLYNEA